MLITKEDIYKVLADPDFFWEALSFEALNPPTKVPLMVALQPHQEKWLKLMQAEDDAALGKLIREAAEAYAQEYLRAEREDGE